MLRHRRMRAAGVVLAAVVLMSSIGVIDVGAIEDPPPSTAPPSSVGEPPGPSSTPGESTESPSTLAGETTTTIDPETGTGGFGPPRPDPDAPPEPPMPDPSPEVRILLEQLLGQNHQKLVVHQAKVTEETKVDVGRFERREQAVRDTLSRLKRAAKLNDVRLRAIDEDLRADALTRYMDPGSSALERMFDTEDTSGRTRGILVEVTTGIHLEQRSDGLARRASLRRKVERATAALTRSEAATANARTRATQARNRAELAAAKVEAEQRLVAIANQRIEADYQVARASVVGTPSGNWSLPIAGQSVFTAAELAQWFIQRGFPSRARAPITELAKYYIDEGNDQGIRGDMAFAQSVLETGSFTNRDTITLNNFAGIGHCDSCASGFGFASPQLGVRAQIQLLADYTERGVRLVHPIVDRRLHGPSGCCQTWWQLTHTWATAGNYGPKIMGI
ncbi:MAG TPA: glucosaminidase domain-containing protein, partial [Acidimicrobiales bacterium]|nr:glucosaminidase domain-containing protein [Acidimicrobiales bacterium]